jgi:hypothetical protein
MTGAVACVATRFQAGIGPADEFAVGEMKIDAAVILPVLAGTGRG